MATPQNLLYPPIIDVAMPAFLTTQNAVIKFSLSKYNSQSEINNYCCVSLTDALTNQSYFDTGSGMRFYQITHNSDNDMSYIEIPSTHVISSNNGSDITYGWTPGKTYKLQIRLIDKDTQISGTSLSEILALQDGGKFSEWSTVCLLRPIVEPTLTLNNFLESSLENGKFILSDLERNISGTFSFSYGEELESYQIKVLNSLGEEVYKSGVIYSDAYATNEVNHEIIYGFIEGVNYTLSLSYTTSNGYSASKNFTFLLLNLGGERLDATITATPNPYEGRIEVKVVSETERYIGNLTIRRSSNRSNFTIWEDVKHIPITSARDGIDETWYDYSVESGIWYKYCVQKRDRLNNRGLSVITSKPTMALLEDMFLSDETRTLRIKFNPQVSSYSRTLMESSSQTIGSKYPFIKRNGNVNYRQFSISGLISHFMDEEELFTSREELYNGHTALYEEYNSNNRINDYNDFILERKFREKVEEFLYDGKVKLFKSTPEGTLLVRLMNVSLNPEQSLGRMLYSFSATAYEIDEVNLNTLKKYEILNPGELNPISSNQYEKRIQLKIDDFGTGNNIISYIENYENGVKDNSSYTVNIQYLKDAKITLNFDPYLVNLTNLTPITSQEEGLIGTDTQNYALGYIIRVFKTVGVDEFTNFFVPVKYTENEQGEVKPYGYLNLSGENLQIANLAGADISDFNGNGKITPAEIECTFVATEFAVNTTIPDIIRLKEGLGQIRQSYSVMDNAINFLKEKYSLLGGSRETYLAAINRIKVEAEPYSVFYKRDSFSNDFTKYLIGESGVLNLKEEDFSIENIYFKGTYIKESVVSNKELFHSVNYIKNPINFGSYLVKNLGNIYKPYNLETVFLNNYTVRIQELYRAREFKVSNYDTLQEAYEIIYINGNWYVYDSEDRVAIHPIYASIDYDYELEERQYA